MSPPFKVLPLALIPLFGLIATWHFFVPNHDKQTVKKEGDRVVKATPGERSQPKPMTVPHFQAGMNVLFYNHPNDLTSQCTSLFNRLKILGVNSVALTFPIFQQDTYANTVTTSKTETPTDEELSTVIRLAHQYGFNVMLRPLMDEKSLSNAGKWRGSIQPSDPAQWFDSYAGRMKHYATLAERNGVQIFDIGTEFVSMEPNSAGWNEVISAVKSVYRGSITYSYDWLTASQIPKYTWAKNLTFVSVDAWYKLNLPNGASSKQLEDATSPYQEIMMPLLKKYKVVFTEAGMLPVEGGYRNPAAWYGSQTAIDYQAQINYYTSVFNTWRNKIDGIYWWNATLGILGQVPPQFSPLGTPTENVIKEYFTQYEKHSR